MRTAARTWRGRGPTLRNAGSPLLPSSLLPHTGRRAMVDVQPITQLSLTGKTIGHDQPQSACDRGSMGSACVLQSTHLQSNRPGHSRPNARRPPELTAATHGADAAPADRGGVQLRRGHHRPRRAGAQRPRRRHGMWSPSVCTRLYVYESTRRCACALLRTAALSSGTLCGPDGLQLADGQSLIRAVTLRSVAIPIATC